MHAGFGERRGDRRRKMRDARPVVVGPRRGERRAVRDGVVAVVGLGGCRGVIEGTPLLESAEFGDQIVERCVALLAVGLDVFDDLADGVHHLEQDRRDLLVDLEQAVAQFRQQVLTDVGDGLQLREAEETRGALDGVDGAKDARERVGVRRLLERDELTVQFVETLLALGDEFDHHLVEFFGHAIAPCDRGPAVPVGTAGTAR